MGGMGVGMTIGAGAGGEGTNVAPAADDLIALKRLHLPEVVAVVLQLRTKLVGGG